MSGLFVPFSSIDADVPPEGSVRIGDHDINGFRLVGNPDFAATMHRLDAGLALQQRWDDLVEEFDDAESATVPFTAFPGLAKTSGPQVDRITLIPVPSAAHGFALVPGITGMVSVERISAKRSYSTWHPSLVRSPVANTRSGNGRRALMCSTTRRSVLAVSTRPPMRTPGAVT